MAYELTPAMIENFDASKGVFGSTDFLPPYAEIPKEFKRYDGTKFNKFFSDAFFSGISQMSGELNEGFKGIDKSKIMPFITAHMRSWAHKHEHNEAGVAYMMSIIFKDIKWEKAQKV